MTQQSSVRSTADAGTGVEQKTIIVLVGQRYSGKSEVLEQAHLYGLPTVHIGEEDTTDQLTTALNTKGVVVVEGVWRWQTVSDLKDAFNANVPIIHVECGFDERLERLKADVHGSVTEETLRVEDEYRFDEGLDDVVYRSQLTIVNEDKSIAELYERTSEVLEVLT